MDTYGKVSNMPKENKEIELFKPIVQKNKLLAWITDPHLKTKKLVKGLLLEIRRKNGCLAHITVDVEGQETTYYRPNIACMLRTEKGLWAYWHQGKNY